MGWFRSRSKWGAYLALLALAFQLAISFGHVHLDHIARASAGARPVAGTQASNEGVTAPSNPTGREDLADDLCPICTLIHVAGTLVPTETPPLPLPGIFRPLRLEAAVASDLTAAQGALFRARAPPLA
jgi:Protein of unknown function (DUF2946)